MSKLTVSFIPAKTEDSEAFLRVSQTDYNKLGLGKTKTGFVPVQPDKAEAIIDMFNNGELGVKFADQLPSGLYELEIVEAEETADIKTKS